MKLTKYRLNKIVLSNGKQTRKKCIKNKLLTHNTSRCSKKKFNLRNTTLRQY